MFWFLVPSVFFAAAMLDVATVRYYVSVGNKQRHRAACWSVVMAAISSFGLLSVVEVSWWLLVPEFAGLYAGTWIAVPKE